MNVPNISWSSLALLSVLATTAFGSDPPKQPNIVLILADDLGWTGLKCFGSDFYETPNIDRLAEQGMRFDKAYANMMNCAPSRASIMSGQYVGRHRGVVRLPLPEQVEAAERQSQTVPIAAAAGRKQFTERDVDGGRVAEESRLRHGHVRQMALGQGRSASFPARL